MVRVKRGKIAKKRRKHLLKYVKGFRWGRKSKYRQAKEALLHAWSHSFRGRKEKKRNYRRLWQTQISAAVKEKGLSYSRFIFGLKKAGIEINRKILAQLSQKEPHLFEKIVQKAKEQI